MPAITADSGLSKGLSNREEGEPTPHYRLQQELNTAARPSPTAGLNAEKEL